MRYALFLVGVGVVPALASAPDRPRPAAAPEPPARMAVAPMPRAVEATRVLRGSFRAATLPADTDEVERTLGVEWHVNVGVRRLAASGRDVIEFQWRIRYDGPRPPLIVRRPSVTDGIAGDTVARFFAFPGGKEEGRVVTFTPDPDPAASAAIALRGAPAEWYLKVPKGRAETGTETILVADLKERLRSRYPAEFPADRPPDLFAEFVHEPWDRGWHGGYDAWTGNLGRQTYFRVPTLKSW